MKKIVIRCFPIVAVMLLNGIDVGVQLSGGQATRYGHPLLGTPGAGLKP